MSQQKSLSSSPSAAQSSFKGRRDAITKHTGKNTTCLKNLLFEFLFYLFASHAYFAETMDLRDWCESESLRLTGTKGIL